MIRHGDVFTTLSGRIYRSARNSFVPSNRVWFDEDFSSDYWQLQVGQVATKAVNSQRWPGSVWDARDGSWELNGSGGIFLNDTSTDVGNRFDEIDFNPLTVNFAGSFTGFSDLTGGDSVRGIVTNYGLDNATAPYRFTFGIRTNSGKAVASAKINDVVTTVESTNGVDVTAGYEITFTWNAATRTAVVDNGVDTAELTLTAQQVTDFGAYNALGICAHSGSTDADDVIYTARIYPT